MIMLNGKLLTCREAPNDHKVEVRSSLKSEFTDSPKLGRNKKYGLGKQNNSGVHGETGSMSKMIKSD